MLGDSFGASSTSLTSLITVPADASGAFVVPEVLLFDVCFGPRGERSGLASVTSLFSCTSPQERSGVTEGGGGIAEDLGLVDTSVTTDWTVKISLGAESTASSGIDELISDASNPAGTLGAICAAATAVSLRGASRSGSISDKDNAGSSCEAFSRSPTAGTGMTMTDSGDP